MKDLNQICEWLVTHPLFQELPADALANVARYTHLQCFASGDTMVWQGEASTTVSLVVGGLAAVTHLDGANQEAHVLAYLMPGASFGEVGILDQQPRSATVQALTEVEVLTLTRDDFMAILQRYPSVAIALARRLGQYLVEADRRYHQEINPARLILVYDLGVGAGATLLGQVLATHLGRQPGSKTALVLYPDDAPGVSESIISHHAAVYDYLNPEADTTFSPAVQATLLTDRIARQYDNAVVVLSEAADSISRVWLMQAQHIVLLVSSTSSGREKLRRAQHDLTQYTASGRTGVSVVAVAVRAEQAGEFGADYVVALDKLFPPGAAGELSELEGIVTALIERINHTHQVAIYVPTTIAVDQMTDTSSYVERTLAFLGSRFGGATSTPVAGVWQSEVVGLVPEAVNVVQTYATSADLHRYLMEVVNYVKMLKVELQQEAMALEVDHQLMLL
ncbi:MAG: cyclic nucleotide-binding domain-containing protein [Anaerolineae bacterium]